MSRLSELVGNLNKRPSKPVEIPNHPGEHVAIWCLTLNEEEQARKRAYEFVRNDLKFSAIDLEYDEQRAVNDSVLCEILATALRCPEEDRQHEPFAENALELRERLNSADLQALFQEYLKYVDERSVLKDVKDPERELDELIKLVAQNFPIATRLSRYASTSLRRLLIIAIDRCGSGTSESLSGGVSPNASVE